MSGMRQALHFSFVRNVSIKVENGSIELGMNICNITVADDKMVQSARVDVPFSIPIIVTTFNRGCLLYNRPSYVTCTGNMYAYVRR